MKRVLITGKNSYLGNQFEQYCKINYPEIESTKISLRTDNWEQQNWSTFDAVIHVAGIAHNSSKNDLKDLYYSINTDLTVRVAEKAKQDSVKQFINLSSMIVYGTNTAGIDKETKPNPDNFYGDSKLQADIRILLLEDELFKVAIVRPPMIYGRGSKGNYPLLAKLAKKTPIFPDYNNKRSMLFVDNLSELISLIILHQKNGLFLPQNKEFVKTSEMVREISRIYNNKVWFIRILNPIISLFRSIRILNKVFGDLYYNKESSIIDFGDYQKFNLAESILKTEGDKEV